jgi:hypothetical protein
MPSGAIEMQRLRLRARGLVFDTRRPGRPRGSRSYCCMGSRRPPPAGSGWRRRWPRSGTGCWRPTSEATRRAPGRRRCVPEAAIPESGAISGSAVAPAPRRVDEPVAEAAATNDRLVATRQLRLTEPAVAAGAAGAVGPGPQPGDNRSRPADHGAGPGDGPLAHGHGPATGKGYRSRGQLARAAGLATRKAISQGVRRVRPGRRGRGQEEPWAWPSVGPPGMCWAQGWPSSTSRSQRRPSGSGNGGRSSASASRPRPGWMN